ncbi:MAG: hypothetical protein ISP90_01515 [Nevskia sp.]|nr:hypothetical protein [Nevskia sp.]
MIMALSQHELQALNYLAASQDPFAGCSACGDFGKRMQALASLRRAGMIDHANRLSALGRSLVSGEAGDDLAAG